MLLRRLAFLAALALVSAAPAKRATDSCPKPPVPRLPVNGGDHELPAPPEGTRLKHVVLGHGYQNYTCAPADASYSPEATGALAVLYDVRPFFPGQSRDSLPLDAVFELAREASYAADVPLNIADPPPEGRVPGSAPAVVVDDPFIDPVELSLGGAGAPLQVVGHHFFDGEGVPVFEVGSDLFKAKKVDSVGAPEGAHEGEDGSEAVAWLLMDDAGGSVGIKHVYRVNTVGGAGHACDGEGEDSSVYSAFYYMYG